MRGDRHLLVESLKLSLQNTRTSLLPPILVAIAMFWVLFHDGIGLSLTAWCAAVIACESAAAVYARMVLRKGFGEEDAQRVQGWLIVLNLLNGSAWGSLVWITLDTASSTESILVNSILAGMAASSMSLLSASMPVFVAFIATEYAAAASKFWQMDDPAYHALLVALTLYLIALLVQGRNCSTTINDAIRLRFDNAELLVRLRAESVKATAAHHQAVEANLAKSRFMAAASHDLRQPAHALGLFLDVLARGDMATAQRLILDSARAASQASADMLNTLLDMSRIDAGVIEAHTRPFELQVLLNKVESELAPQADAKGLVYRTRETDVLCESDPGLVELILRNFVTNAVRYTRAGGVLVGARRRHGCVWLEVWDTGIGIDPSKFEEIFHEFHQLHNPERDRSKGLGLGLAIADGLARQHGHRIELASMPGRGSVFRLILPTVAAAAVVEEAPAAPAVQTPLRGHVLVIDDDAAVRTGMAMLVAGWGCTCDVADSTEQALSAVYARIPDAVISDFRLRGNDLGTIAIASLNAALGKSVRAMLITGETTPERLREAQLSNLPLLHKPVASAQVYAVLRQLLEGPDDDAAAPAVSGHVDSVS